MNLREIFTPLIAYALLLTRAVPVRPPTFQDVRQRIEQLLATHAAQVRQHDIGDAAYDLARFAVLAWIDELIITKTTHWESDLCPQWRQSPLQIAHYHTANAGEEFFQKLEQLGTEHADVREIYHLCLCLGFRGRYYQQSQEFQLVELQRKHGQRLVTPVNDLVDIEKAQEQLTPQPYTVPSPPTRQYRNPAMRQWRFVAGLAVATLIFYLLWPSPPEQGTQRTTQDIIAEVNAAVHDLPCAAVSVSTFENGLVTLRGNVESEGQRQEAHMAARTIDGVSKVHDTLTIIPPPFCTVLELLSPFSEVANKTESGLRITTQKGCDVAYVEKEFLHIETHADTALQHTYIDYYVADGSMVAHLFPNAETLHSNRLEGNYLSLGAFGTTPRWQVQSPFGLELITVLTSSQPLLDAPRPATEGTHKYLAALRQALSTPAAEQSIAAAFCFITTQRE